MFFPTLSRQERKMFNGKNESSFRSPLEDWEGARNERADIVTSAVTSRKIQKKARLHATEEGLPVQTFGRLLEDLETLVRNVMQSGKDKAARFAMLTKSTPFQQKALELLGVSPNI